MTSTGDLKPTFDRDGFVVVRSFLPPPALAELQENLDRYIRDVVPRLPDSAAFYHDPADKTTLKQMQHMGADPYFAAYAKHLLWVDMAAMLLGEAATGRDPEWFNKPPGVEHPTPPHQDNYYFCLRPASVATLWLALDAVDEQNGCLRYVAGSHRRGIRPHARTSTLGFSQGVADYGPTDEAHERQICLEPGDLAVHHGETIHRADPNRSTDRQRRAFAIVFQGASARRDDEAYARYTAAMQQQHQELGLEYLT